MNNIKRNVAMIGYVNKLNENDDELNICHGNGIISNVDYENCLMLPFDQKEINLVYKYGKTVIGYINNNNIIIDTVN